MFSSPSALIFLPLLGALVFAVLPAGLAARSRAIALFFGIASLGLAVAFVGLFDPGIGTVQMLSRREWIPSLGVEWVIGLDGLSLILVVLSALLVPFSILMTPRNIDRPRLFFGLLLLLHAAVNGVFLVLNFVPWFLFWELTLIPAFFLIKLWGGSGASRAAYQFFLYTLTGSIAMLIAFLALFKMTGSMDLLALASMATSGELSAAFAGMGGLLNWVFAGVLLGMAVKVPIVPFHTWLPDTYAEAPSSVSMLLTGLLSKMGVYGLLRIVLPIFPAQMQGFGGVLMALAVLTILFSAVAALAQTDMKRLLGYSSINHLGYCLLAIIAIAGSAPAEALSREAALAGVYLQVFNHGLTAATLFGFIAVIESRSGGLRGLNDFGGLRGVAPVLWGMMAVALFSSLGLPGLNGFVGEFLIFAGSFGLKPVAAALALPGLLLTAIFLLRILTLVFSGPLNPRWEKFPDLSTRERLVFATAIGLMLLLGLYPAALLDLVNATVSTYLNLLP